MAVTSLKRKDKRNYARKNNRNFELKRLTLRPVIKNVDVEAIKASFEAAK